MNLKQLTYFKKLAELQHYTKAATELLVSQPALSYSISSLEEELGTSLFQKQGRNIVLTKHGKKFYSHVVTALSELDRGVSSLKQNTNIQTGTIDIGVLSTFSGNFINEAIRKYTLTYPKANFNLYDGLKNEVIEGLKSGLYDVGFCTKDEKESNLVYIPMLYQELVLITSKDHEFSSKDVINISCLEGYPLITYRDSLPIGKTVRNLFSEHNIMPNIILAFNDESSIAGMVSQDFGIALVVNSPLLKQYDISIIPLDIKSNSHIIYLVYNKDNYQTKATENFIKYMANENSQIITPKTL